MKNKDILFDLIKSLSKNEKRFFKMYASQHITEKKNSLLIFEVLDKQYQYDEKKVIKELSNKSVVNNYSYNKHYLLQLILRSLHSYNYRKNSEELLRENLHYIEILFEKSQFNLCEKIISNSIKLAEDEELFFYMNEFLNWKNKFRNFKTKSPKEDFDYISKIQSNVLKKEINLIDLRDLYTNFHIIVSDISIRNLSHLKKIEVFISIPLLKNANKALSLKGKYYYYFIHRMYFLLQGNRMKALDCSLLLINQFEKKRKSYSKELNQFYVNSLVYLLLDQATLSKTKDYFITYEKLSLFLNKYPELQKFIFPTNYLAELTINRKTKNYETINYLLQEYETKLKQYNAHVSSQNILVMNFQISTLFIEIRDFKSALKWINKVLIQKELLRKDIFLAAKFVNLIIQYELCNYELLESEIKSTYRYLLNQNRFLKSEFMIVDFLKNKIIKTKNNFELLLVFKEMHKELELIAKNPIEENFFLTYFDFRIWLKSKI